MEDVVDIVFRQLERLICGLSLVFNSLLLLLILFKSRKEMGKYKYFLFAFVGCDVLFSMSHLLVEPVVAVRGGALLIYGRGLVASRWAVTAYACIVAQCLLLIAYHFIYRALVVTGRMFYFFGKTFSVVLSLVATSISLFGVWFTVIFTVFRVREEVMLRKFPEISEFVDVPDFPANKDDLIMILGRSSATGEVDMGTIWGVVGMLCVTGGSVVAIAVCWMAIARKLRDHANFSAVTLKMQRQMFRALVVQFYIPCAFIYGPFGVLVILPYFPHSHIHVPPFVGGLLYSLYPLGDFLAILLFIHDYRVCARDALRRIFCCEIPVSRKIVDSVERMHVKTVDSHSRSLPTHRAPSPHHLPLFQ